MSSRGRVRRSLCPNFNPKKEFDLKDQNSQLSELSDASDAEWNNIQSKLKAPSNIFEKPNNFCEDEFVDPLYNIENLPICANMNLQIDAKQKEVDRVQQIALDLQDRFIWDLSLAIKKELFRKNSNDYTKREQIANVGISGIVEMNQNDPKSPEEWKDWITSQYPHSEKL